jgi:ADP-L-glycero-D-manno-heptose 6-epimerase
LKVKVVVTGASGFIGRNLCSAFDSREYSANGIDREYFDYADWADRLVSFLAKVEPQSVFHVGACSDTLVQDVQSTMIMNYQATKVIADWCHERRIPLIYSSSAATYGANGSYPSNLYGWSKYVAEDYVLGRQGLALRYFNVYGPGEEDKGSMSSFAFQSFSLAKHGQPIQLFPGNPTRDFVYVKDVVSANNHAFRNFDYLKGRAYEVGSGQSNSFETMLSLLRIPFSYAPESAIPVGYQFYTESNPSLWMEGWQPRYDLVKGIEEYRSILEMLDRKGSQ